LTAGTRRRMAVRRRSARGVSRVDPFHCWRRSRSFGRHGRWCFASLGPAAGGYRARSSTLTYLDTSSSVGATAGRKFRATARRPGLGLRGRAAGPQAMNTSTDWGCDQGTASLGTMATALRHGCALVEGHAACYRPKQSRDEAVLEFVLFLPISLQNRCFANSFT
jgi:hypothetical protein